MLDTNSAALRQSHWELREDWVHFDENKDFLTHTDTFCGGIPTNLMFLKSRRLKLQMSPSWWFTADHQADLRVHLLFVFWPLSLWASLKSFSQPCCVCKCDKTECEYSPWSWRSGGPPRNFSSKDPESTRSALRWGYLLVFLKYGDFFCFVWKTIQEKWNQPNIFNPSLMFQMIILLYYPLVWRIPLCCEIYIFRQDQISCT